MKKLSIAGFLLIFGGLIAADDVPVIVWGPHIKSCRLEAANPFKSHSGDEFFDILSDLTTDTVTFVIAEDQVG